MTVGPGSRAAIALALLLACRSHDDDAGAKLEGEPEPVRAESFRFERPAGYVPLELNPHGEFLLAPPDARASGGKSRFVVRAGGGFVLEIDLEASGAPDVETQISAGQVVVKDEDLLVYGRPGAYRFVVVREVVPEWDESDRRRYTCSSPGALSPDADGESFPRSAVERMVAACRTLTVPKLE